MSREPNSAERRYSELICCNATDINDEDDIALHVDDLGTEHVSDGEVDGSHGVSEDMDGDNADDENPDEESVY